MRDIFFLSAGDLLELLDSGELTSRELLEMYLARIERYNDSINAIIYLSVEEAREATDRADKARAAGERWGPLHGLPFTVKDVHHVAGWPTTYGDPSEANYRPETSATIINRLRKAGAIIFGKTNVPLHSADFQTFNKIHGSTRNPWDLARSPGGSSGGAAAALAAGFTSVEIGTDIAGSIRFPAHFCGLYSHKPSHGIVTQENNERKGQLVSTDLSTAGPMARSPDDLALLLDILAAPGDAISKAWHFRLPPSRKKALGEFRIGLLRNSDLAPIDNAYQTAIGNFVSQLELSGASVDQTARPDFDFRQSHEAYIKLLRGTGAGRLSDDEFEQIIEEAKTFDSGDSTYKAQLRRAQAQSHRSYMHAEETRANIQSTWARFFEDFDVLLTPVTLSAAYLVDEETVREERVIPVSGGSVGYNDQLFWSGLTTLPSLPVTTIPIGTVDGLPVGINVVGAYLEDLTTITFAKLASSIYSFRPPPNL